MRDASEQRELGACRAHSESICSSVNTVDHSIDSQ